MVSVLTKIKLSVKNYLDRMAEVNRKEFGDHTLDCCKLNQRPIKKKKK